MSQSSGRQIDTVMQEERLFPPREEFVSQSRINSMQQYQQIWDEAKSDPIEFWRKLAVDDLHWFEPFKTVLQWNEPFAKWFVDGTTNASYNCLDVHLENGNKDKMAILWEGEPGDTRELTYGQLHFEVCKFANVLKQLGYSTGRCGIDLHAHGSGTCHCNVGLCADRSDSFGDLCRFFLRGDRRSKQ